MVENTYEAWLRLCNELKAMSHPEARPPRFNRLLNAIWIAATKGADMTHPVKDPSGPRCFGCQQFNPWPLWFSSNRAPNLRDGRRETWYAGKTALLIDPQHRSHRGRWAGNRYS